MAIAVVLIVLVFIVLLTIVPWWLIFRKAGRPGWAILIPIYNVIVQFQVAKMSPWLVLLMLIPVVNVILSIILTVKICSAFNKGAGFTLGMIFLPFIFAPILGYGGSEYDFDEEYEVDVTIRG